MNEDLPYIPEIDVLVPPKTIFYPPVADVPYLDPLLLPSLEQVESGLADQGSSSEEETSSSKGEELQLTPETIPTIPPNTKDLLSTEEPVATFNIPFFGEMPIPSPEVIASSVIASSVSATAAVTGSIVLQSVINQLKKIMTKIFKKVLKKEIANQKKDQS
tara:strand:+ start:5219 stop:5701 length:483 start_codon:yes stop_codon:yes gene_type:complete